ncbi:MAG: hypothetical protein KatS3mg108_1410 [Isosphaeraceae bacterium]|jgi:4-amino-4-deoxy-L-arabinose transferase-like glycosyltransferase|nr:MAG: hypothetical protein KatS3mg108_1410 [Isosphaeraceae bacterium]
MRIDRVVWGLMLLAAGALVPAWLTLDQPIVENYVGRQVPTAMVARHLARGGSFWRPERDTGPFPSWFLVEPPVYAGVVGLIARGTGVSVEVAGRLVSMFGAMGAAAGLGSLVGRRHGRREGWLAAAVFLWLPVTLRYGRAVQPDVMALGLVVLGLNAWDRWVWGGRARDAVLGWLGVATGIAARALLVFVWLPVALLLVGQRTMRRRPERVAWVLLTLAGPALAWYLWAWRLGSSTPAVRATGADWLAALGPASLSRWETWRWIGWFGLIRAFTPWAWVMVGACLVRGVLAPIWVAWLMGALVTLGFVSGKLHHEYYWLMAAPAVAAGVARWVGREAEAAAIEGRWPWRAVGSVGLQLALSVVLAWSTWRTPAEWSRLKDVRAAVAEAPGEALWIGREAVLYYADRRGMRLENEPEAVRRALEEWGVEISQEGATPRVALSWYHTLGAWGFAEVGDPAAGRIVTEWARAARAAARRILVDEPGLLVLELEDQRP